MGSSRLVVAVTDTRQEFADLFGAYAWLMVVVTAVVYGLVLFCVVRYRRRPDSSRRHRAPVAEALYALLLAAVVVVLVTATFRTERRVDTLGAHPFLTIRVTAFDWQWRFGYPSGKTVTGTRERQPMLRVPQGTRVRFELTSRDVVHAFWIPALRFKRDAFPKRTTSFDLTFERAGTFAGRCAEFCGLRHSNMGFLVRVVPAR